MDRTDLAEVFRRCAEDPELFERLLEDPDAALEAAGIRLSEEDHRRLLATVERGRMAVEVDLEELLEEVKSKGPWYTMGPWKPSGRE